MYDPVGQAQIIYFDSVITIVAELVDNEYRGTNAKQAR